MKKQMIWLKQALGFKMIQLGTIQQTLSFVEVVTINQQATNDD